MNVGAPIFLLIVSMVLTGIALAQNDPAMRIFRGHYDNVDCGFSLEIPDGLFGSNYPAPAPNHGFGIAFGQNSVLWIDASYENTPDSPHRFGRFNAQLGPLKAERKSWRTKKCGVKQYHESIVARGFDRHTPIIYNIQIDTTAEYREQAGQARGTIVKSFHTFPVRP